MFESLLNPKRAEEHPWLMFFVGLIQGFLAVLIASAFKGDPVLSKYLGILVVTFCVILSLPFVYFIMRYEERKDKELDEESNILKEHGKAIMVFLWLFLGFTVAFAICYMIFPNGPQYFSAQVETYCQMNNPYDITGCLKEYGLNQKAIMTGAVTSMNRFVSIFTNNVYVVIFTLFFSLIFGAGAIFILAWNASVIAAAIGMFVKSDITHIFIGMGRYLIHGIPEIAAYFVAALAGGILGVSIIRREFKTSKFWDILEDVLTLLVISIIILIIAGLIEVFITPILFK